MRRTFRRKEKAPKSLARQRSRSDTDQIIVELSISVYDQKVKKTGEIPVFQDSIKGLNLEVLYVQI